MFLMLEWSLPRLYIQRLEPLPPSRAVGVGKSHDVPSIRDPLVSDSR